MREREPRGGAQASPSPARPLPRKGSLIADAVTLAGPYDPTRALALQRSAGNAAVGWLLTGRGARRDTLTGAVPLAVQRGVTVGGKPVSDPVALLRDSELDQMLSETGGHVLRWALGGKADLTASDAEGLLLEVDRVAAMIDLVQSIVSTGILGRKTLTSRGMGYSGSNDSGNTTALAVNVLDNRGGWPDVGGMVDDSLTATKRGSFSVAMERPVDDDMVVDQMQEDLSRPPAPVTLTAAELSKIREQAQGDATLERLLIKNAIEDKRGDPHAATMAANQMVFDQRAQNTVLAIVPEPDKSIANLRPGRGGYESSVPSDQIPPGPGGFTMLVFPSWFEKFAPLMLRGLTWPDGLGIRFVGDRKITAHYRAMGQDWPITLDAPDYASEIATQLEKFEYVATHILKTPTA